MAILRNRRKITQGGVTSPGSLDIVLQSPELFHFDISSFISSLESASQIDFASRAQLYDLYNSAVTLDLHLKGILRKRLSAATRTPVEFRRDGKADDAMTALIRAPWFRRFLKEVLLSQFWGFSLFQFFYDRKEGRVSYSVIDRKHYDPVRRRILRYETDVDGIPIEDFPGVLVVCDDPRALGDLAGIVPYVLYKRNSIADWAQFCSVFGIPIREYTYDAGDEDARQRLLQDARRQGANAVYIHPKDSNLNLIESSQKSGTVDLFERFKDAMNKEMSVAVLGNTLTTDSQATGTQALGTVHQDEEEQIKADDRDYVLDVLNFQLRPLLAQLGMDTEGGEFAYAESRSVDASKQIVIVEKLHALGLPISDDYLYRTFDVEKPDDYDELKAQQEMQRQQMLALRQSANQREDEEAEEEENKNNLKNRLRSFFAQAPHCGA